MAIAEVVIAGNFLSAQLYGQPEVDPCDASDRLMLLIGQTDPEAAFAHVLALVANHCPGQSILCFCFLELA